MSKAANRVREYTSVVGTGTVTLTGTLAGFVSFNAGCDLNEYYDYYIEIPGTATYEGGRGKRTASNTFTRETVFVSSNSNNLVDFPAGIKIITVSLSAETLNTVLSVGKNKFLARDSGGAVMDNAQQKTVTDLALDLLACATPLAMQAITGAGSNGFDGALVFKFNFDETNGLGVATPNDPAMSDINSVVISKTTSDLIDVSSVLSSFAVGDFIRLEIPGSSMIGHYEIVSVSPDTPSSLYHSFGLSVLSHTSGSWSDGIGRISFAKKGLNGTNGTNGSNGLNGKTIHSGFGNPSDLLGVEGDFYIDLTNTVFFGPKLSTTWSPGFSLIGPPGLDGDDGLTGPAPSGTGFVRVNAGVLGLPGQLSGDVITSGDGLATTLNTANMTAETRVDSLTDLVPLHDVSATSNRRMTVANMIGVGGSAFHIFDDFIGGSNSLMNGMALLASGTGAGYIQTLTTLNHGALSLTLGTVATNIVALHTLSQIGTANVKGHIILGNGKIRFESILRFDTLSTSLQRYTFRGGLISANASNTLSGESPNGVFFRYTDNVNTGNFQCVCRSAGIETTPINTSVPPTTNGVFLLAFEVNANRTSVEFFINGTSVGALTGSIPSTYLALVPLFMQKSVGTTTANITIDRYDLFGVCNPRPF